MSLQEQQGRSLQALLRFLVNQIKPGVQSKTELRSAASDAYKHLPFTDEDGRRLILSQDADLPPDARDTLTPDEVEALRKSRRLLADAILPGVMGKKELRARALECHRNFPVLTDAGFPARKTPKKES
jgi:hypothetical protein